MELKKQIKTKFLTIVTALLLICFSCQEESIEIINPDPAEVIESSSELTSLLNRIILTSNEDDIDYIDFQYPLSISIFNTSFDIVETLDIDSDTEFASFLETLDDGVIASLNYPTTFLAEEASIEINSNVDLEAAILDAIQYNEVTVGDIASSEEAKNLLIGCSWVMDRYIVDNGTSISSEYPGSNFQFLEDGTFIFSNITYGYDGAIDPNSDSTGTTVFNETTVSYYGTWDIETNSEGNFSLILDPNQTFPALPEYIDYNYTITTLIEGFTLWSAIGSQQEIVTGFEQVCDNPTSSEAEEEAKNLLLGCNWVMDRYIDNGEYSSEYPGDTFQFLEDGRFIFTNTGSYDGVIDPDTNTNDTSIFNETTVSYYGTWDIETDSEGNLSLILDPNQTFPALPEYIDYNYNITTLREGFTLWSAIGSQQEIVTGFEQVCDNPTNSEAEEEAKNLLLGCNWIMDRYIVNGEYSSEYPGDTFQFLEDGRFIFTNTGSYDGAIDPNSDSTGTTVFNETNVSYYGTWDIETDSEGNLSLILDPNQTFPTLPEYIDYNYTITTLREGFTLWSAIGSQQEIVTGFEQVCL